MKKGIWMIASLIILLGCSYTCKGTGEYPGPYCTSSFRSVCGDSSKDDIFIVWREMNCSEEAAIDTIACMCRNNTLPGIRFSRIPDQIKVNVNSGELEFDLYIGRDGDYDGN